MKYNNIREGIAMKKLVCLLLAAVGMTALASCSSVKEPAPLRRGVYVCRVQIDGKTYKAVTNVGVKPTVRGDGVSIETHIIGYDGDLYGRDITVSFYRFLRDEIKFDSLEALKKQIEKDRKKAGEIKI